MTDAELRRRASTGWRRAGAWLLLSFATSAALYFGISARVVETITKQRGPACVELKNGRPSEGCERIARLVVQTCVLRPSLCEDALKAARRKLPPVQQRRLDGLLRRTLADGRSVAPRKLGAPRRKSTGRRGVERQGSGGSSGGAPAPHRGGSGGAAPAPSSGGSGGGGSGAPAPGRPSPSDTVNGVKGRARDSANDVTQAVGAGRPVPALPDLPATPMLPCVPVTPLLPCA